MTEAAAAPQRIGVFGSAFNPPQNVHLAVVEVARRQLGLDHIVVVPTGRPYHKDQGPDPGPELRLQLAEAAFGPVEGVAVSPSEIEREGPSYTYATLDLIAAENPDSEIYLLMGADAARGFGGWKRPERILELARIAVAPRPGVDRREVQAVFEGLGAADRVEFIAMPAVELSSSLVRERIAAGESLRDMVPAAVSQMIDNEGVYGTDQ